MIENMQKLGLVRSNLGSIRAPSARSRLGFGSGPWPQIGFCGSLIISLSVVTNREKLVL
jgi:hypothetical protein